MNEVEIHNLTNLPKKSNTNLIEIPLSKPSITDKEIKYINDALKDGWADKKNYYVQRFEENLARKIGVRFAVATSSCTGALHLGLAALGLKEGDEVIVPETSWIASVSPIKHLGAKPIFVDICEDSWCINPKLIEKVVNAKTRAIIPVHLYGNVCELDELKAISKRHSIPIIEDAAEGLGSYYSGRHVGSFGLFSVFSFHGSKTITTGEGGALLTNNEALYEKVKVLNEHGRSSKSNKQYWPEELGYKFKISNLQAALGCAQIERCEEIIGRKREILGFYKDYFSQYSSISFNPEPEGTVNGAWMPTAVFSKESGISARSMVKDLGANNIDARSFFWPLSSLNFFEAVEENIISRDIQKRAINLPSFFDITREDLIRVCSIIEKRLKNVNK